MNLIQNKKIITHFIIFSILLSTLVLNSLFRIHPNSAYQAQAAGQSIGNGWSYTNTQAGQTYTNTVNNPALSTREGNHTPNGSAQMAVSNGAIFNNVPWEEAFWVMTRIDANTGKTIERINQRADRWQGGEAIAINSKYAFISHKEFECPNWMSEGIAKGPDSYGKTGYFDSCNANPTDIVHGQTTNYGTNSCSFYYSTCDPTKEYIQNSIRRVNLDGSQTAFPNGRGGYHNEIAVTKVDWKGDQDFNLSKSEILNMASTDSKLFVLMRDYAPKGMIRAVNIYDPETMQQTGSWMPPTNTTKIFGDKDGFVWLIQEGDSTNPAKVSKYNEQGIFQNVTITGLVKPNSIAMDAAKNLYVADSEDTNQIYVYNNLTNTNPTELKRLGSIGGLFGGSNPGKVEPMKFNSISGIAIDELDNLYVSNRTGGQSWESYKLSDNSQRWVSQALEEWTSGAFDPATDGNDMYLNDSKYTFDWNKPLTEEWSLGGVTENYAKYPSQVGSFFGGAGKVAGNQSDNCINGYVRRIQGQKYYYCVYGDGRFVRGFRFEQGSEVMIPMMRFEQANPTEYFMFDNNGNGLVGEDASEKVLPPTNEGGNSYSTYPDENGGIWRHHNNMNGTKPVVDYFPADSIDQYGAIKNSYSTRQKITLPIDLCEIKRLVYDAVADELYVTGFDPCNSQLYTASGNKMFKFTNVKSGSPVLAWSKDVPNANQYPYLPGANGGEAMHQAGNYLFFVSQRTQLNSNSIRPNGRQLNETYIIRKSDGQIINETNPITIDATRLGYQEGLMDSAQGIRAFKRKDGEYLVNTQDTGIGRQLIYRVKAPLITGKAFLDTNGNGLMENGEQVLSGVNVKLVDSTGKIKAENSTDSGGNYTLYHQDESGMKIKIDPVAGQTITGKVSGGNILNTNLESDSINHSTFGETNMMIGFGSYVPTSSSSSSSSSNSLSTSSSSTINTSTSSSSSATTTSTTSSFSSSSSVASSTPSSTSSSSNTLISTITSSSITSSIPITSAIAKKLANPLTINSLAINTLTQGNSYSITNQIQGAGNITNLSDLSATIKPTWDATYLYISAEVMDDNVNPMSSGSLSSDNKDGIEIMLDLNNNKSATMDGIDDCKLALAYGEITANNSFGGFGTSACNTTGVETLSTLITGGYRIDAKIPWSTLKVNPSVIDNQIIGFDMQVNDNDGGATGRDSIISYNGTNSGSIWNTPSTWGTLKLDPTLITNPVTISSSSSSSTVSTSSSINSDDCLI